MVFVFCGNFVQRGWEAEGGMKRYTSMSISVSPLGRLRNKGNRRGGLKEGSQGLRRLMGSERRG